MIATAAAGNITALPKLANRSAAISPSNTTPACDGAPIRATVAASEGRDKHQDGPADAQHQLGEDGCEPAHQCAPASCLAGAALPGVGRESPAAATRSMRAISRPTSLRIGLRKLSG